MTGRCDYVDELDFDRDRYEDVHRRGQAGNYFHQMAKAEDLAERHWDRA